jgi:heterodisulfide reductase subunit B
VKTYSYYPGCSLEGTAKEYNLSLRALAPLLGMQLVELEDWSCCGSSAAHVTSHHLALSLAARNLNLAASERHHGHDLLIPCAMCYNRLRVTAMELAADAGLRSSVEAETGAPWRGGRVQSKALPEVLWKDLGPEAIARAVVEPLAGLKIASYYGCLLVRPREATGWDDPEDPQSLDEIVRATGAEPVAWSHKVECCGGGLSISRRELVARLVAEILAAAQDAGADAIVTACPMCHANLDTRQGLAGAAAGRRFAVPVLYITQLLGLACGVPERRLSLGSHLTAVRPFLSKWKDSKTGAQAAGGEVS